MNGIFPSIFRVNSGYKAKKPLAFSNPESSSPLCCEQKKFINAEAVSNTLHWLSLEFDVWLVIIWNISVTLTNIVEPLIEI